MKTDRSDPFRYCPHLSTDEFDAVSCSPNGEAVHCDGNHSGNPKVVSDGFVGVPSSSSLPSGDSM